MLQFSRRLRVRLPDAAFDGVEFERPVDSTPEVVIANRGDAAESFPLPMVFAPLGELPADSAADVAAAGEQRDAGRSIERFEAADDCEQFQAAAADAWLAIGSG